MDNPLQRLASLQAHTNLSELFESMDAVRYELLLHALDQIRLHTLVGTGFGGSTLELSTEGGEHGYMRFTQVVHNAYLQVWADMGLAGLVGFCGLVLGWIALVPRWISRIRQYHDPVKRAYYYNAMFLLLCVALFYMFHPISTECSDWIRFGAASAILGELGITARGSAANSIRERRPGPRRAIPWAA
jgi:O-antigen ligase